MRAILPVAFYKHHLIRKLSVLSGGMLLGQALLILSTPVITRLYTPEDFGFFAIFGAFVSILAVVVTLRYEIAIPLQQDNREAAALGAGTVFISIFVALLICPAVWFGASRLSAVIGGSQLAPMLWLLPPCLALWGIGSALGFWSIRQSSFRLNGINRIILYGTQAGGQLGFGFGGLGSAGLILGYALGYLARLVHFSLATPKATVQEFLRPSATEIWVVLRRNWRFPVLSTPAAVLQTSSAMLPAVLIAMLYGPALAGLYALAQRVVGLPLRLLGESANQVFLGELRQVDHAGLLRLFSRTAVLFAALGLTIMVPLSLIAPWLFAKIFGETWRDAGFIIQLLAPLYLVRLVVTPISQTLNVLQRQDIFLISATLSCLALFISFAIGGWFGLEAHWTIGLFSASASLTFVFTVVAAWRNLKEADWQKLRRAKDA